MFCAHNRPRNQVSVYMTIDHLVLGLFSYLRTIKHILITLPAGTHDQSQVSDRCPCYLFSMSSNR